MMMMMMMIEKAIINPRTPKPHTSCNNYSSKIK